MDQRELDARIKALNKALNANEPASNIISLLDSIKKDAAPTEEMLRVSGTAMFMRSVYLCDTCMRRGGVGLLLAAG